jgi:hypothetical protein
MAEQLSQASPDLLRQMVRIFAEALMSADADAVCGAAYGSAALTGGTFATATGAGAGTPGRQHRAGGAEAAGGQLLPRLVARAAPAGRIGACQRGRNLLSARRQHPQDGEAGPDPRHHGLSKSQVSEMAKDLDSQVEAFRAKSIGSVCLRPMRRPEDMRRFRVCWIQTRSGS